MNLENFFNSFNESNEQPKLGVSMSNLTDSPLIWIGTFEKLILNYCTFSVELVNFFKMSIPDLDDEQIKNSGREIVCNKSFEYLNKIDVEDKKHLESLKIRSSEKLIKTLKFVLQYFESVEDYEKCAKIRDVLYQVNIFYEYKIHDVNIEQLKNK